MSRSNLLTTVLVAATFILNVNAETTLSTTQSSYANANSSIQRVRIDFTTPLGYVRHLLLGFTPDNSATDGVDYGYDGLNPDNFPDDLNWMIEEDRYVIQGVGAFEDTKVYPLGLFLTNEGDIEISLNALENFSEEINVYVFDAYMETYTLLNDYDFNTYSESGTFTDRFFITFMDNNESSSMALSVEEHQLETITLYFDASSQELVIRMQDHQNPITQLEIFDASGRTVTKYSGLDHDQFSIPREAIKQVCIVQITNNQGTQIRKIALPRS